MRNEKAPFVALGLAGDGDESDLIRDLEQAFAVDFGARVEFWRTVGDIEDDLLSLYPASAVPGHCGSAMAFRQLRRNLPSPERAAPATALRRLLGRTDESRFAKALARSGVTVRASEPGSAGITGVIAAIAGIVLTPALLWVGPIWVSPVLVGVGLILMSLDRRRVRRRTLGDLAGETAARNFAVFAERGADRRREAIWRALVEIVCVGTGAEPARVERTTRLFD